MKKIFGLFCIIIVFILLGCENPISETPKNDNNNLASVELSAGTISPNFSSSTTDYTVTVPNDITEITITGVAESTKASVSAPVIKSDLVAGRTYTGSISVTSENGDVKVYRFTILVTPKSNNNNLASVELSSGTISPNF